MNSKWFAYEGDVIQINETIPVCDVCIAIPPSVPSPEMIQAVYGQNENGSPPKKARGLSHPKRPQTQHNIGDYMKYTVKWVEAAAKRIKPGGIFAVVGTSWNWPGLLMGLEYADLRLIDTISWVHRPLPGNLVHLDFDEKITTNLISTWSPIVIAQVMHRGADTRLIPRKDTWNGWATGGMLGEPNFIHTPDVNIVAGERKSPLQLTDELVRIFCPQEGMSILNLFARGGTVGLSAIAFHHDVHMIDWDEAVVEKIIKRMRDPYNSRAVIAESVRYSTRKARTEQVVMVD